ncbi:hypothetical protein ANRL1_00215 [Anaerolineae bacterium]|nr:hypothetical protein ANRL1_00215 [Anaerolineae bacterium]
MIRLKRVYEPPANQDGVRILVERLWLRGMTKERAAVDVWLKEIAPSPALRTWYGHDPAKWDLFRARYRAELAHNPDTIARLKQYAKRGTVTLVYAARDAEHNSTVVLKEFLE